MNNYQKRGFNNRWEYMKHLAAQYGVSLSEVLVLADKWGPLQEFHMLPKKLSTYDSRQPWLSHPASDNK